jgi:cholesterol transport system auxiliary component
MRLAGPSTALVLALIVACGSVPTTRYYELVPPTGEPSTDAALVIAIEPFEADAAYDDDRIVYRANAYRLDYYHYHRWSSPPGVMVAGFVERALEQSGEFRAVVREGTNRAAAVLGGRVVAIEEIDRTASQWEGRIALELTLTDPTSGEVLWSEQYEEREPLAQQSPEGLARALSDATARITARAAPEIARAARRASTEQADRDGARGRER